MATRWYDLDATSEPCSFGRQHAARLFAGARRRRARLRVLDVSRHSVMRCITRARGGRAHLRPPPWPGANRSAGAAPVGRRRGPRLAGAGQSPPASRPPSSWTLPRVAVVIARLTGIRLSPRSRVANPRAGWHGYSSARPSGAKERKSVTRPAVQHWVDVRWPTVNKTLAAGGAWLVFQDESGFSQRPPSGAPGPRAVTSSS